MNPKRPALFLLFIFGIVSLCVGLLLTGSAVAQSDNEAEYTGSRECASCHRSEARNFESTAHALALQEADEEVVVADFTLGESLRLFQFPDEEQPRAFGVKDISYVIGSGRNLQAYLYQVERNVYKVLPALWNVQAGEWVKIDTSNGDDWTQNCAGCHTTGLNVERGRWEDDGVLCESCHGPGSLHVDAARDAGRRPSEEELIAIQAAIVSSSDPQICGQCHSQGVAGDGVHPFALEYRPGEELSATFDLAGDSDDECWWPTGHANCANMQYNEWLKSAHADPESEYAVTCESCHEIHQTAEQLAEGDERSLPDGLCLSCHEDDVSPLYFGTLEIEGIANEPSTHAVNEVACVTCHMPDVVTVGDTRYGASHLWIPPMGINNEPNVCADCHNDLTATALAEFAADTESRVESRLGNIQTTMTGSEPAWVASAVDTIIQDGSFGIHNVPLVMALLDKVEREINITPSVVLASVPVVIPEDPAACAECHGDMYTIWQNSAHAQASLRATFQETYARNGRQTYCFTCHASGFDPQTQSYVFEGVVCSSCHTITAGTEHPPAPMEVATDSIQCGRCHSGEHSPEYNQWLLSPHSTASVDCADCHTPHDNGLRLQDVNTTCADCHEGTMEDEVHMGEDMTCTDCHMTSLIRNESGKKTPQIHHTMFTDPQVCSECHGDIHILSAIGGSAGPAEIQRISELESQVTLLEGKSEDNLQSGILGGAVGALVLIGLVWLTFRLGRIR